MDGWLLTAMRQAFDGGAELTAVEAAERFETTTDSTRSTLTRLHHTGYLQRRPEDWPTGFGHQTKWSYFSLAPELR